MYSLKAKHFTKKVKDSGSTPDTQDKIINIYNKKTKRNYDEIT